MVPYLKLPMSFEAARLVEDLDRLETAAVWHSHPDYTVAEAGAWTALALVSTDGDHTGPDSLRYRRGAKGEPTKLLLMCPYLRTVIDAFRTDVHRARLMSLKPGTVIAEHRDYGQQRYSIERGMIRVHIPIRTHEAVAWKLRGETLRMEPGQAWYVNVCLPHAVENRSSVNRVHLVLDMQVNSWVRDLFPVRTPWDIAYGAVLRRFEPSALMAKRRAVAIAADARRRLGDMGLRTLRDRIRSARS